jgi:hypothetical protein
LAEAMTILAFILEMRGLYLGLGTDTQIYRVSPQFFPANNYN